MLNSEKSVEAWQIWAGKTIQYNEVKSYDSFWGIMALNISNVIG